MLAGKKVLLAVTGSIAAYKTAFFVRLLVKEKAEVQVIMTENAKEFITPLTLSTLSKNPVLSKFSNSEDGTWNNHVDLGLWADLIIIAPATANTIAKIANGICESLLEAVYLSARCPVMIAPAMDLDMYRHPTTLRNLQTIRDDGKIIIDAENGELASGLNGVGRMAEPEELVDQISAYFSNKEKLTGKKVIITSGPTQEPIDQVRFIGNRSSGKMGMAIAEHCANLGAEIQFISGPVHEYPIHPNIEIHKIKTAQELLTKTSELHPKADIVIFVAAVADYRPGTVTEGKMKRNGATIELKLEENPDVAFEMGKSKSNHQIHIGFALEVENEKENAQEKLTKKNFDFIVLNSLRDEKAGFEKDTNKISIFDKHNNSEQFELKSKSEVARDILNFVMAQSDG